MNPAGPDSIEVAIGLIRSQPVPQVLDDDRDDLGVIDDIQAAFVQQFAVDDAPGLYPGGEQPADFLARFNVTVGDFAQARRYVKEEHRVFQRTEMETSEGSGRLAGLASPPTPLPAAVAVASTAGSVGLTSGAIDDPAYRASGALQTLDYLRWGARKALRQSLTAPTFLAPRLRPIFAAAAAAAETEVGHLRVQVLDNSGPPSDIPTDGYPYPYPTGLTVLVHGVQRCDDGVCYDPEIGIKLVRSVDGLRCVLHGNIEGAPCNPDEYVLASEPDWFDQQDQYDQELDGTFGFDIPRVEEPIFVVKYASPPVAIGGFWTPGEGWGAAMVSMGGQLLEYLDELSNPSPTECGQPQRCCAGLPCDLVVPLESEITEDADPYENSWKHYLDLADQMATEADALGEELIRAGLDLDMRGEAARDELEGICGGVVNVANIFESAEGGSGDLEDLLADAAQDGDPSLATCLPDPEGRDREPWVTLGSEDLCAWQYGNGAACVCPSDLIDVLGSCKARCPAPRDGACELPPDFTDYNNGAGPDDQRFGPIPAIGTVRKLGLLPAPGNSPTTPDCGLITQLRDPQGPLAEPGNDERQQVIEDLVDEDWFSPRILRGTMSSAMYDEDWRDRLEISVRGRLIFSSRNEDLPPCDEPVDGEITRATAPTLFPEVPDDLEGSICRFSNHNGRRFWIGEMRRAFGTLGLLTASLDGNMARSWAANGVNCEDRLLDDPDDLAQQRCDRFNEDVEGCEERQVGGSCDRLGSHCVCLDEDDPSDGAAPNTAYGNVTCPAVRFDHTVDLSLADLATNGLNRLWWGPADREDEPDERALLDLLRYPVEYTPFVFDWEDIFDLPWDACSDRGIFYDQVPVVGPRGAGLTRVDLAELRDKDVYDALALGCYLVRVAGGGCEQFDPTFVPEIRDPEDLAELERQLHCTADSIMTSTGRGLLANVPKVVADSVGSGQPLSLYPGYRGQLLDALVALQSDIEQVAATTTAIQAQVRRVAYSVTLARQQLAIEQIQGEITELQTIAQMLSTVASALATSVQSFGTASSLAMGQALAEVIILGEIQALQAHLTELEQEGILTELASQVGDILAELTRLGSDLRSIVYRLNADLGRIESLRSAALSAAARAAFMDRDETGRLFPVTTVMRRRYNTLRIRYERARDRARQMAFIARRAIEQRFGLRLEELDRDLTLVESPATWASDVCDFEGIDYARIRQAQVDEELPEDEWVPENYVDGYLGEYVDKLRLFVETYPFDFPFQDGNDLAVISLRDDILRAKQWCEVTVPNLLGSSEQMTGSANDAEPGPWFVDGCPLSEQTGEPMPCLVLDHATGVVVADREASRIVDADIDMGSYTGRVYQDVFVEEAHARVLLSWQDRFVESEDPEQVLGIPEPVPYVVTVERIDGVVEDAVWDPGEFQPEAEARQRTLGPFLVTRTGMVRVSFEPSASDDSRGDVWLAEVQLEVLGPNADHSPSAYMPTVRSGVAFLKACPDLDGEELRSSLFETRTEHICPAGLGRNCGPDSENVIRDLTFHEAVFGLGLEQIERGEIIPSAQIALGNYNYRHDLVAVNLVGTNVRDCSESDEPATCYSNAFVPFTLIHEGEDIPIRNHDGDTVPFDFERAFIEHGKSLASEVVLTNPLAGSMETLLGPYYKQELRGRPLMGHYTLRIWHDAALNWENVEDVQLVFRYRYWTRFER